MIMVMIMAKLLSSLLNFDLDNNDYAAEVDDNGDGIWRCFHRSWLFFKIIWYWRNIKKYCSRIIRILIILSTTINTWFETRTFPSVRNLINWKLWKSSSTSDLQSFDRIVTVVTLRLSWRWELLEPEGFIVERIPLLSHKGSRNELQMCFLSVVAAKENKSHPTNCEVMQTNKNTEWKIDFLPLHNLYFLKIFFRQPSWEYICKLIRQEWHDRDYNTMGGIQYKEEGHDFVMRMPTSGSPKWLRRHALPCPTSTHLHTVLHCHTKSNVGFCIQGQRRSYIVLYSFTLLHRVQNCHTKS